MSAQFDNTNPLQLLQFVEEKVDASKSNEWEASLTISNFYLSNFPGMPSVGLSSVQRGKMLMDIDIFPILRSMENKGKILMFCEKKYPVENDFKGDGYNKLSLDIQLAAKSIDCCSYVKKESIRTRIPNEVIGIVQ